MRRIWVALCLLHVLRLGGAHCSLFTIRGLDPSLAEHYKPKGDRFSCLDGQKTIMYSLINDDFCDCFDGSDEPGTSACVHGQFYCRNRGYTPKLLNASMVDDGFCDCCDGSDESSGKCGNTCARAGAAARAELKAKAAREAAGAKVKAGYVQQAQQDKQRWQDEAAKLGLQIAQQQKLVNEWKVKKDGVEAAEAKDRARKEAEQREKEEAQKKLDEERAAQLGKPDAEVAAPDEPAGDHITTAQPANAESGTADAAASDIINKAIGARDEGTDEPLSTSGDVPAEASDDLLPAMEQAKEAIEGSIEEALKASKAATDSILNTQMEQADDASMTMNPHEAAKKEAEETSEERAKRIASQWIKDDSSDPTSAPAPTFDEPQEQAQDMPAESGEDAAEAPAPSQSTEPDAPEPEGLLAKARSLVTSVVSRLGFGPPIRDTAPSDSQKIKDTYWQHHNDLASLESRDVELKKQLSQDYGRDGEFLTLRDRCFTADVDKYVYEICPYGDSAQKDGQSRTSLGSWKGFEENYSFMSFSGGQICWNGPQRSMRVALQCGEKEHLQHVVEPSKCEYVAEFMTPAVCHAENAEKLQQQLFEDEQALHGAHVEL